MKVQDLTRMALLVAMNCVSAYIIIPLPFSLSPLALQTLVVNIVALLLPVKQVFWTMSVYVLLGLAGAPVFTGGTAGPGKLFGPTGGYVWAFVLAAVLIAFCRGQGCSFRRWALVCICVGMPAIYIPGLLQLMFLTGLGLREALVIGVLPFLVPDVLKCLAAAYLAGKIQKSLH